MSEQRGTVLVTGATGLIGKQTLAPLVAAGFAVHAVARRIPSLRRKGTTWQAADLMDPAARAAIGTSEWSVMPGEVFTSRK